MPGRVVGVDCNAHAVRSGKGDVYRRLTLVFVCVFVCAQKRVYKKKEAVLETEASLEAASEAVVADEDATLGEPAPPPKKVWNCNCLPGLG